MRARTKLPPRARRFYAPVLQEAEQVALEHAQEVEGLDQEIALLRVKLLNAVKKDPDNLPTFLKAMELLVRAVSTRYRISRKAEADLYQSVVGVLEGIGEILGPREAPSDGR